MRVDVPDEAVDPWGSAIIRIASEPQSHIEWGGRLSAGWGPGQIRSEGALAARMGLEGEYWLSRHIGIGVQAGWSGATSVGWAATGSSGSTSATADARSVGATILLRGSAARTFPVLALGAGYAWGNSDVGRYCGAEYMWGPYAGECTPCDYPRSDSGPGGSLTAK